MTGIYASLRYKIMGIVQSINQPTQRAGIIGYNMRDKKGTGKQGGGMKNAGDDALMVAIGTGDKAAATFFIERHTPYVLKICMARLKNQAEAEEATQDVFLSVWKKADSWQPGAAKVTTWLYRVAANRCIDLIRRKRPTQTLDDVAEPIDEADNAETLHQQIDRDRLIRTALKKLNENQQRAIALVYFQEMNQREAAAQMDISIAALESILRRARQKLHDELARLKNELYIV